MKTSSTQMSESLSVGLLLASVGGFLESYSFLCRDGVFANCQTGNMVLLALSFSKGEWTRAVSYLIPILSFVVGVALTELIRFVSSRRKNSAVLHWRQYIILFELILLAVTAFLPSGSGNLAATTVIAFSCSIQVESFRKVKGSVFATTMCTGNLRSGTYQLFEYFIHRDKDSLRRAGHYFSVILIFMAGAALGGFLTLRFYERAVFFACALLLLVFLVLFIHPADAAPNE